MNTIKEQIMHINGLLWSAENVAALKYAPLAGQVILQKHAILIPIQKSSPETHFPYDSRWWGHKPPKYALLRCQR